MFNFLNFVVGEGINNIHQLIERVIDNIIQDLEGIGLEVDLHDDIWADINRNHLLGTNVNMIGLTKNATLTKEVINMKDL